MKDEKFIPLKLIRLDGGTQPRAELREETIANYAEAWAAGANFPAVVAFQDGKHYWLADGFHRYRAAERANAQAILTEVRQGTQADAQWHSYSVNQTHGLPREPSDKRRAVEAALRHANATTLSDGKIAEHCGVGHTLVAEMRKLTLLGVKSTERTGRDGRTYDVSNIGKGRTREVVDGDTGQVIDNPVAVVTEEAPRRRADFTRIDPKAATPVRGHGPDLPPTIAFSLPTNDAAAVVAALWEFLDHGYLAEIVGLLARKLKEQNE